jgi:hypothetical protein
MFLKIQTLYIFLAALLLLPLHFYEVWNFSYGNLSNDEIVNVKYFVNAQLLADIPLLASIAILIVTGFLFKKQRLQRRLIKLAVLFFALFAAASYYIIGNLKAPYFSIVSEEYQAVLIFPCISLVLLVLAYIQILKDENLLKALKRYI